MNQSNFAELLAALTAERDALHSFADLLEHEQKLLIENQTDQLLELAEKKSAHAILPTVWVRLTSYDIRTFCPLL